MDEKELQEEEQAEEKQQEEEKVEQKAEEKQEEQAEEKQEEQKQELAPWYDGIEDEKVLKFAKTHPSPGDLASFALETRQKLSKAVFKPSKNASEEDVAAFRKAMGVPEEASGYKTTVPEDLPEKFQPGDDGSPVLDSFKTAAHDADLNNAQVQKVLDWYYGTLVAEDETSEAQFAKAQDKSKAQLDKEWGNDAKRNHEVAVRAVQVFGGDELTELLETAVINGTPLGDHTAIAKTFAKIGLQMAEADPLLGSTPEEKETLQEQHAEATAKMHEARDAGDNALAIKWQAKRSKISEQLTGNVPIVGRDGRAA